MTINQSFQNWTLITDEPGEELVFEHEDPETGQKDRFVLTEEAGLGSEMDPAPVNGKTAVSTSDDLVSIASNASAGDTIELAAGTHAVSSPVVLPQNTTIDGIEQATIKADAGLNDQVIKVDSGCVVKNLTIDGDYTNQTDGGCSAHVTGAADTLHFNVYAKNGYRTAFGGRNCTNATYIGCTAEASGDDNFAFGPGADNILISNCVSRDGRGAVSTSSSGYEVDDGAERVTIASCVSYNNVGFGVEVHDHDTKDGANDVTVTGHVSFNDDGGLHVGSTTNSNQDTRRVRYDDYLIIDASTEAILTDVEATEVDIGSGYIFNPGTRGVSIRGSPGPTDITVNGAKVVPGVDTTASESGVLVEEATGVTLRNISVESGYTEGFEVASTASDVRLENCYSNGASARGFLIQSPGAKVINCESEACDTGVEVQAAAEIRHHQDADATTRGITSTADDVRIINPDVDNAANAAIRVIDSLDNKIRGGQLTNSGFGINTTGTSDRTVVKDVTTAGNTSAYSFSGSDRILDGEISKSASAETPASTGLGPIHISFTDTGDGSGDGLYYEDASGTVHGPL